MKRYSRSDPIRRGISVGISLLMLTLSVVVPVLERGSIFDRPIVEREHNPGDCPSGHDHTVCTQVVANHGAPTAGADHEPAPAVFAQPTLEARASHRAAELELRPPSRGPPSAAA